MYSPLPLTSTVDVNTEVPVHVASLGPCSSKRILPVGLLPPDSVATSAIWLPTGTPRDAVVVSAGTGGGEVAGAGEREGDGAGGVVAAGQGGGVGDLVAEGHPRRRWGGQGGVGRRRGDHHRLVGGVARAGDQRVVGVARVGGDPPVGPGR